MKRNTGLDLLRLVPFACALVVIGFLLFGSTGRDDPYISYWPAHTLAKYGQILNYNGERVEQSSTLLFVGILGAFSKLTTLEPHQFAPPVSIAFGLLAALCTGILALRIGISARWAVAVVATSVPLVYWSFSGMETSLVVLLAACLALSLGAYLCGGSIYPSIAVMAAWLMVRPESPFTLATVLLGLFVIGERKRVAILASLAALMTAALIIWRLHYFGVPLPQPAMAKGGLRIGEGLKYVALSWPLLLMCIPVYRMLKGEWEEKALAVIGCAVFAFCLLSGGDWMEGGRFLAPLCPVAAIAVARSSERLRYGALAANGVWLGLFAAFSSYGTPLFATRMIPGHSYWESASRIHARDINAANALRAEIDREHARGRKPIILTSQMGYVVYNLALKDYGQFRVVDRAGLCDRQLTAQVKASAIGRLVPYKIAVAQTHPDLVYDLNTNLYFPDLVPFGYRETYDENKGIPAPPLLHGAPVFSSQFIAKA